MVTSGFGAPGVGRSPTARATRRAITPATAVTSHPTPARSSGRLSAATTAPPATAATVATPAGRLAPGQYFPHGD